MEERERYFQWDEQILNIDETILYPKVDNMPGFGGGTSESYLANVPWSNIKRPHRFSGPAEIFTHRNGNRHEYWWINGHQIDGDRYKNWLLDNGMDIKKLSVEDKMIILLTWMR